MNPTPTPTPTATTTVSLDLSAFVGPALWAAALTLAGTVTLFLVGIRRENKHRFTADRRAAYSELLASAYRLGMASAEVDRILKEFNDDGDDEASRRRANAQLRPLLTQREEIDGRRASAFSVVQLVAPERVVSMSRDLLNLPTSELNEESGRAAVRRLVAVMRSDLGIKTKTRRGRAKAGPDADSTDPGTADPSG